MAYETLKLSRDAFTEATWLCGELPSAGRVEFLDTWCWTEDAEPGWRKLVIEAYCSGMRSRTEQLCRPAAGLLGEEWPKRRLDALGLKRIAAGIQGDEVELSIDEQHIKGEKGRPGTIERRLIVSAKRSKFSLKLKAMEAEPQAWPVSATAYHVLYAADLARILGRTRFAIDRGHSHNYAVGAAAIDLGPKSAAAVGTNGCRLATDEVKAKPVAGHKKGSPLLIYPEAARLVAQLCGRGAGDVHVWESGNLAAFAVRQHTLLVPTVEGRFPAWRDMAKGWGRDDAGEFNIRAGELVRAVNLGSICCDARDNVAVFITLNDLGLVVAADKSHHGESCCSLPATGYRGRDVVTIIDHRPLKKWLALVHPGAMLRVVMDENILRLEAEDGAQLVCAAMSPDDVEAHKAAAREEQSDVEDDVLVQAAD